MAAMAASGDSILPRGTPCWSTTASRTVRSPADRIAAATSCTRASRSGEASPCRPTNPGCPTPEGSALTRVNNAVNQYLHVVTLERVHVPVQHPGLVRVQRPGWLLGGQPGQRGPGPLQRAV